MILPCEEQHLYRNHMLRSGNHHCVLLCCGINVGLVFGFVCFAISYIRSLFVLCVCVLVIGVFVFYRFGY